VPFCAARCPYCAFPTAPLEGALFRRYLRALDRELAQLATLPWAARVVLDTVFVGGGTPSLLPPDALAAILERLRAGFRLAPGAEITVECNPESVSLARLTGYRAAGVTRLSLGVQSLDDSVLRSLGRQHTAAQARAAWEAARSAGYTHVSVDLMYGLPGLSLEGWRRTVEEVLAWQPEHLSAYALTLDPGSVWGTTGIGGLPDDETVVAQYWWLARAAAERGYEHYEISNYARPGFRSRHNLRYWRRGEYLAAGPGAAGFVGDLRWVNARATARYCTRVEAGGLPAESWERLTRRQVLAERLLLGLRTRDGVAAAVLEARLDGDARLRRRVADWEAAGWLERDRRRVRLTEAGFLRADALLVDLL
jgi:oxygen-independent coproporphyrinogen-3 oxidase